MKPATEQQKEQVFFMPPKASMELNAAEPDENVQAAYLKNDTFQSAYSQNTTTHD